MKRIPTHLIRIGDQVHTAQEWAISLILRDRIGAVAKALELLPKSMRQDPRISRTIEIVSVLLSILGLYNLISLILHTSYSSSVEHQYLGASLIEPVLQAMQIAVLTPIAAVTLLPLLFVFFNDTTSRFLTNTVISIDSLERMRSYTKLGFEMMKWMTSIIGALSVIGFLAPEASTPLQWLLIAWIFWLIVRILWTKPTPVRLPASNIKSG